MKAPTPEDYEEWKANPVTAWVMTGVQRYADLQREAWAANSWTSGNADQDMLDRFKLRAETYEELASLSYEDAAALHETQEGQQ